MVETTNSRHPMVAGVGVILILSTFFSGWAPTGPWNSESFSRGLFGLTGGLMLYISWYRHTFGVWGAIPALKMWTQQNTSVRVLADVGFAFVIAERRLVFPELGIPTIPMSAIDFSCSQIQKFSPLLP